MSLSLLRLPYTIPGVGCSVTFDADGFRVYGKTDTQIFGTSTSMGPFTNSGLIVDYTGWGNGLQSAGVIAMAVVSAMAQVGGLSKIGVALLGITLVAARLAASAMCKGMFSSLSLRLTKGSANSDEDEVGVTTMSSAAIQAKCDYMLSKYKLREDKQPFMVRRWTLDEKEYSTPECGFTFKLSSDEKEGVSFLTEMRSIFIGTDTSERTMPIAVNGAEQAAQTNSYFGAEREQPAKGADALYYVRKGGQAVMKASYLPNVPVPNITDIQKYNTEILRNRNIISIRSAKTYPVDVWCVLEDGGVARIIDDEGKVAWSRISTTAGKFLDTAVLSIKGQTALRTVAVGNENGIYIAAAPEEPGLREDTYLDVWREYFSILELLDYTDEAYVYDAVTKELVSVKDAPEPGLNKFIGYLYESKLRTLPQPLAQALKPSRIARAKLRLMESHLPYIKGFPSGTQNRIVSPFWNDDLDTPLDGIVDVPVPGNVELDAAFEVYSDKPAALSIICMETEED
jgi:hypothetical protein